MADFPLIQTQRLLPREVTTEDAPALLSMHGDRDLMKWFGSDPIPDLGAAEGGTTTFCSTRFLSATGRQNK